MRTLLVDNHDSYTFNLFQLLAEVNGTEPTVLRNDDPSWRDEDLAGFDNVVVSPGPGRPQRPTDLGHSLGVIARSALPLLGVCLGHQAIAHAAGAIVGRAPEPRHGHLSRVKHTGAELFLGVPQEFVAVRYHSLSVAEPLPEDLEALAWAEDGVLMALRHRHRPQWGVQFHPESVAGEYGRLILENFRDLTRGLAPSAGRRAPRGRAVPAPASAADAPAGDVELFWVLRELPHPVDTELAHHALHAGPSPAFWLDSSRAEQGLSRFSFLGDTRGPLAEVLTYRTGAGAVLVEQNGAEPRFEPGDVFEVLNRRIGRIRMARPPVPFPFTGGYVGYFGYELKAESAGVPNAHTAATADAVWMFADRLVAVDHEAGRSYVLALHRDGGRDEAEQWAEATAAVLAALPQAGPPRTQPQPQPPAPALDPAGLVRSPERYRADVARCQELLRAGESYEICLTDTLRVPFDQAAWDDLRFYGALRRLNPAPYGALLRIGEVAVFSSSPERFLRVDADRTAESKPIKGTAPRGGDEAADLALRTALAQDPKSRAENLMIVDLLRNDLGRVCEIGSVAVPVIMAVESYATVHQLVSTVRGRLRPEVTAVDCARACFPGGSMTGAPKIRTLGIIDALETSARGVYSGALGYFSLSGEADLSIVIRTAVRHGASLTIGAGGAVVLASDPEEELNEMLLKARASLRAMPPAAPADHPAAQSR
jgi:para-aminobenzoate synthetase